MKFEIKKLFQLRQQIINIIHQFPADKRQVILFDQWSLREILAHLSGWDVFTAESVEKFKSGKLPVWGGKINIFNQKSLEQREKLTWTEIYNEFIASSQKMIDQYQSIDDKLWNQKIWPDKSYTPAKFLKIDIDHYQDHLEEIKKKI